MAFSRRFFHILILSFFSCSNLFGQHAIIQPVALHPVFNVDFRINETFLYNLSDHPVYETFDSIAYRYDEWARLDYCKRFINNIVVAESVLEYDALNRPTRVTSLAMDTFYFYNDQGLLYEKNVSNGNSDPTKAIYQFRYVYNASNQLIEETYTDLKNYDTITILSNNRYYYNTNGKLDSVHNYFLDTITFTGVDVVRLFAYSNGHATLTERVLTKYSDSELFVADSIIITNLNEQQKPLNRIVLDINDNGFQDTVAADYFYYEPEGKLLWKITNTYTEGIYTNGNYFYYDYDFLGNLLFEYRYISTDSTNWELIDRVRWVVSGDDVKYIEKPSMLISPNPVNCCGQIIIFAGDPDAVTIDITDISGKKVISISATLTSGNNILNLPVSDFPIQYQQGYQVFYIRVTGNKTFAQTTFIKL